MRETLFVDVILPLALPKTYSYRVPNGWNEHITIGKRVIVQFGKGKKQYSAIIKSISKEAPKLYEAKYIEAILDETPIVSIKQIEFWEWIAEYYMANIGDVMNAALPSGLRLASETVVQLHPDYTKEVDNINDELYLVVEALELHGQLDVKTIAKILNSKSIHKSLKKLIEKRIVITQEEVKRRYKPKYIDFIELSPFASEEKNLKKLFDKLEKAPKQLDMLMTFIQLNNRYGTKQNQVKRIDLQKQLGATSSLVNQLVKKDVFNISKKEVGRLNESDETSTAKKLNEFQEKAYSEVKASFKEKNVCLLHGVTSSGKTEIYIRLIEEQLAKGKQVLYLLPEIALTTQIVQRLIAVFGSKVGVYHSKFNENERVEVWNKVIGIGKQEEYQLILGARSAMFLPFQNLGLIIVDEEHETTFKQMDPSPRYQARDSAIMLANLQSAKVLLGSATPSIESYYNAKIEKYGYVQLNKRYANLPLPEIQCVDIKEETKKRKMKSFFSSVLLKEMEQCLEDGKQVILFQNRRGYAPLLQCETCGNSPNCINCDVTLTYHKYKKQLNCHYCGYHTLVPKTCPSCGDNNLTIKGFGTEKIEEELAILLPKAKVGRMDLDTTRSKKAYQQIIGAFELGELDILVGTQMVSKGLDFGNVKLVGILNADSMLNFPDFRAFERSYQLMSQVAGRAGRKGEIGKVIIQSYNPEHNIIREVIDSKYDEMYTNEIVDRRNFKYPPFYRLIKLSLRHRDEITCKNAANYLSENLKQYFGDRLIGPETPYVTRVRNLYHQNIMLKLEIKLSLSAAKDQLQERINSFKLSEYKSVRVSIDVDCL